MKAVILIGGEGTRLRPLTCNIPKAVVPILNQPFLERMLCYLKEHGIDDIILASGYLPDRIQACVGDGTRLGVRLTYIVEKSPLGTAGAVKNAGALLDGAFFVINGDILTDIDLTAMMKRHNEIRPKASIALTPVDNPTLYGVVETNAAGMVQRFIEKPTWDKVTSNVINAGIYILETEVLDYITPEDYVMFESNVFPTLLAKGSPVMGYPSNAYWIDIGTPEKYLKAHHDLLAKPDFTAGPQTQAFPEAYIESPVLIGEKCAITSGARVKGLTVLGRECRIKESAVISGAVLWDGTQVEKGAVVQNCVIGSNCCIKAGSRVPEGCVLGDNVVVREGEELTPGTRLWPGSKSNPRS